MYCSNCGAKLADNMGQCPACGAGFPPPAAQPAMTGTYYKPPEQKLGGIMMYNKIVRIYSAGAFALFGFLLLCVSTFFGIVGLFKHDVLIYVLLLLLLVALNAVAAVKNVLISSPNVRWKKAGRPDHKGKHECIVSCLSAAVFVLDIILLMSGSVSKTDKGDLVPVYLTVMGLGIVLNIIAAVFAAKNISDTDNSVGK